MLSGCLYVMEKIFGRPAVSGPGGSVFPEGQGIICHGINDGKGFQADAHIPDLLPTVLETFLDDDAGAFKNSSGFPDNFDQSQQGAAVGEKIVDQQNVIFRSEEFL